MNLLYIVKNRSNKIKIITDEDYTFSPDQSFMSFSNAMKIYHQGKPFSYEKDAKEFQRNRKFFIVTKNKKLKEYSLSEYKKENEKWKKFSKRMKKKFKGDIYHSKEDAIRFFK